MATILEGEQLKKDNRLAQLSPSIDHDGLLRVGGRLQASEAPLERKHPVILPFKSHLTELVINKAHHDTLHGGNTLTLEKTRQQFWILNGLKAVKGHIHKCTRCHRFKADMAQQMMGILPKVRVTEAPPFSNCGVDYAGPFELLLSRGRGHKTYKGYVSVFICLTTKAIHLETVTALTAEAFVAAFKRFVARRGPVANIYSDNGTNFVGANKILNREQEQYNKEVHEQLQKMGTSWHFIPPASPHFGGLWEAGVKSMKHHLRRVIGENKLTYEEMCTLMTQIEACLNSRPLCPLSEDPESLDVLTPGHFLIGAPLLTVPWKSQLAQNPNILKTWERLDKLHQEFWKKWSTEFLSRLQQRPKWTKRQPNIEVGHLVLIKDEQLPPSRWAMGRVIETHAGPDGLVRVVTLKTKGSILKRPITKISLLPIIDNEEKGLPDFVKDTNMFKDDKASTSTNQTNVLATTTKSGRKRKLDSSENTSSNQDETTKSPPRKNAFTLSQAWIGIFTILFLFASALGQTTKLPYHISKFEQHEGIYFESISNVHLYSSDWNIIIYYDLDNYWRELFGIRKTIKSLTELCDWKMNHSAYCQPIIYQLNHQLAESDDLNTLLYQQNDDGDHRIKRAPLEIIGSIAKGLFGVLDQEFADEYENQIRRIGENENLLRQLLKNQTSILENTLNVVKKDTQTIESQIGTLTNQIDKIENYTEENERERWFLSAVLLTSMHLNTYQTTQRSILSVITDTKHGRLNTLFLKPDQLKDQLKVIREHLPQGLVVPGGIPSLTIYNMMHIRMRVLQKYAIFDVKIPLLNTDVYQLYNLIPIPLQLDDKYIYIQPSSKYLIINHQKDRFTPLSEEELRDCTHISINQLICNLNHPIYNLMSNQSRCEMDMVNHQRRISSHCELRSIPSTKIWVKLRFSNAWIFAFNEEVRLEIFCKEDIYKVLLNASGIISLEQGCGINHATMRISPSDHNTQKQNLSFIPDEAIISTHVDRLASHHNSSNLIPMTLEFISTKDIAELKASVDQHKLRIDEIPYLTTGNVHHFTAIYFLVITGIIWAVYIFYRRHRTVRLPQPAPRTSHQETIHELPTFS